MVIQNSILHEGQTEPSYNFQSNKVKELYDVLHSKQVTEFCKTPLEITENILPSLQNVINDPEAYQEAKNKWDHFSCIVDHIENGKKIFDHFDDNVALCFSLYAYTYH